MENNLDEFRKEFELWLQSINYYPTDPYVINEIFDLAKNFIANKYYNFRFGVGEVDILHKILSSELLDSEKYSDVKNILRTVSIFAGILPQSTEIPAFVRNARLERVMQDFYNIIFDRYTPEFDFDGGLENLELFIQNGGEELFVLYPKLQNGYYRLRAIYQKIDDLKTLPDNILRVNYLCEEIKNLISNQAEQDYFLISPKIMINYMLVLYGHIIEKVIESGLVESLKQEYKPNTQSIIGAHNSYNNGFFSNQHYTLTELYELFGATHFELDVGYDYGKGDLVVSHFIGSKSFIPEFINPAISLKHYLEQIRELRGQFPNENFSVRFEIKNIYDSVKFAEDREKLNEILSEYYSLLDEIRKIGNPQYVAKYLPNFIENIGEFRIVCQNLVKELCGSYGVVRYTDYMPTSFDSQSLVVPIQVLVQLLSNGQCPPAEVMEVVEDRNPLAVFEYLLSGPLKILVPQFSAGYITQEQLCQLQECAHKRFLSNPPLITSLDFQQNDPRLTMEAFSAQSLNGYGRSHFDYAKYLMVTFSSLSSGVVGGFSFHVLQRSLCDIVGNLPFFQANQNVLNSVQLAIPTLINYAISQSVFGAAMASVSQYCGERLGLSPNLSQTIALAVNMGIAQYCDSELRSAQEELSVNPVYSMVTYFAASVAGGVVADKAIDAAKKVFNKAYKEKVNQYEEVRDLAL